MVVKIIEYTFVYINVEERSKEHRKRTPKTFATFKTWELDGVRKLERINMTDMRQLKQWIKLRVVVERLINKFWWAMVTRDGFWMGMKDMIHGMTCECIVSLGLKIVPHFGLMMNARWTDDCMNERMHACMDSWMHVWVNECTNVWMNEHTNVRMNEHTSACMNGWIHEWMTTWMNE